MNGTNIHENKNKSRSKFLVLAIAVVAALALIASPLVAMNDAAAVKYPGFFKKGVSLPFGQGETTLPQVVGGQEGEE